MSSHSWFSKYHLTVFSIPSSNCSEGSQPSSCCIFVESMAYLMSCPSRSFTKVMRLISGKADSGSEPCAVSLEMLIARCSSFKATLPNTISTVLMTVLTISIFFHSLNPPILYVSAIFPLWKTRSMARAWSSTKSQSRTFSPFPYTGSGLLFFILLI